MRKYVAIGTPHWHKSNAAFDGIAPGKKYIKTSDIMLEVQCLI